MWMPGIPEVGLTQIQHVPLITKTEECSPPTKSAILLNIMFQNIQIHPQ